VKTLRPIEIEKSKSDVTKWQATMELAEKELVRQKSLLKLNTTSLQDRDRAQEQLSVAKAELSASQTALELLNATYTSDLELASAEIARANASFANAKVHLSYATITAPIAGTIASVSTQEGETVSAGLNAPTFVTIIDLKRLQVDAYVDEVDIGKIHVGQNASFTVDTFPSREFKGEITTIYPKAVIQENVVNYDVVIDISDSYENSLRPEMTASVSIYLESRENVLAIPARAVKRSRGKNIVYIEDNGMPVAREIKVGWKEGQWIEVASGLEEGQIVYLSLPANITR
jgi:macrolide-specific efflux system membrane fusion protein